MPDYKVKISMNLDRSDDPQTIERLVRAKNEARAIAHVVKDTITIARAETDDVIRLTQAGVKMEQAE